MIKRFTASVIVILLLLIVSMAIYSPDNKDIHNQKTADKITAYAGYITNTPIIKSTATPIPFNTAAETSKSTQTNSPENTPKNTPVKKLTAVPVSTPDGKKGLVELLKLDSSFVIELKYATTDNFTGKKIYTLAKCIINRNTALKLIKANNEFKKKGYTIKIFDAYRPHSVQKVLWDAASDKSFVADPKKGSVHNRGAAVDITLVDKDGKELEMPSNYDEFTKRARLDYKDCPRNQINNRELLGKTMVKYGFKRISNEWWHFDDTDAKKYPIQDISFESFQ